LEHNDVERNDIFVQTKYTYQRGQDHRLPYDPKDPYSKQVDDSLASSLKHLKTDYIDSLVLHGPFHHIGISDIDLETWSAMEGLLKKGQVKFLGVSNFNALQLVELLEKVSVKPHFVQNRCYANSAWDKGVRNICSEKGLTYQGFSLLTANRNEISSSEVGEIAQKYAKTIPQIVFRFCLQRGMISLTGSTDPQHLREDLNIFDFELSAKDMSVLEDITSVL